MLTNQLDGPRKTFDRVKCPGAAGPSVGRRRDEVKTWNWPVFSPILSRFGMGEYGVSLIAQYIMAKKIKCIKVKGTKALHYGCPAPHVLPFLEELPTRSKHPVHNICTRISQRVDNKVHKI